MAQRDRQPRQPAPRHVPSVRPGRHGGKRDENRRQRVRDLCGAALTLMMREGIEPVTVDQIARVACVAKGSFYRYFRDKPELVETMMEPLYTHLRQAFSSCESAIAEAGGEEGLQAAYLGLGDALTRVLFSFPREVVLYLQECRGPAVGARVSVRGMADEIRQRSIRLTELARDRGLLTTFDARVSALAVVGAAERLLFEVLSGGDIGPPQKAAEGFVSLVMDGMRPRG